MKCEYLITALLSKGSVVSRSSRDVRSAYREDDGLSTRCGRVPDVCPGVATKALPPLRLQVIHAMLKPSQMDAMPSRREGQGFESA